MADDPTISLDGLKEVLSRNGRLFGLDVGSKTIGLSLSDVSRTIASPFETIRRRKFSSDVDLLLDWSDQHQVEGMVVGLPINFDGSEGPRAQSTRAFVNNLSKRTHLYIAFWDERLSTAAVERTLLEADASRKRRGELIDKMAAAYILQGALDFMNKLEAD